MNKIAPSLFAGDFFNLSATLEVFENAKVDMIHYDVMDNHFVPNISFGAKVVEEIARRTQIPADVHLMIDLDKEDRYRAFLELPIQHITIHLEAMQTNIFDMIEKIKNSQKTVGISIKPKTAVVEILPFLDLVDLVLLMSVEPGFSGQSFMPDTLSRIQQVKKIIGDRKIDIQVDGGIGRENYKQVLDSGANFLVMGSAFFKDNDIGELVRKIQGE